MLACFGLLLYIKMEVKVLISSVLQDPSTGFVLCAVLKKTKSQQLCFLHLKVTPLSLNSTERVKEKLNLIYILTLSSKSTICVLFDPDQTTIISW